MRACRHNVYLNKPREKKEEGDAEMKRVGMHEAEALADKAAWVLIIKNIQ